MVNCKLLFAFINTTGRSFHNPSSGYHDLYTIISQRHKSIVKMNAPLPLNSQDDDTIQDEPLRVEGVTLKMAFDRSYAVADNSDKKSERFTCPLSLDLVHRLRRCSDAVLVGRRTVERDDCTLTVRRVPLWKGKEQPARVVLDPQLKIFGNTGEQADGQYKYTLLKDDLTTRVYYGNVEEKKLPLLLQDSVTLVNTAYQSDGTNQRLSPHNIIQDLKSEGFRHLMIEGGSATAIEFLSEKLIDRAIMIRAPMDFIDPVSSGMSDAMMNEAGLELLKAVPCGDDTVEFWSKVGIPWPTGGTVKLWEWPC